MQEYGSVKTRILEYFKQFLMISHKDAYSKRWYSIRKNKGLNIFQFEYKLYSF